MQLTNHNSKHRRATGAKRGKARVDFSVNHTLHALPTLSVISVSFIPRPLRMVDGQATWPRGTVS